MKFKAPIAAVLTASVYLSATISLAEAQSPVVKTSGLDFSPYLTGQNPNLGSQVMAAQIFSRLSVIAPYTLWARSFSSTGGNENTPSIARQLGLKVAANAWISSNAAQNQVEIANLIAAANAGLIDVAIVGSEAILRNDVTVAQLIAYMNQVRQAIPSSIPVTTADVWGTFLANPSLITASDVVYANLYPYWEGTSISNAMCSLEQEYQQLVQAAGTKAVVVSETGWPSAGNAVGAAVPSVANANLFALQFLTWAHANNVQAFYFESFNEDWKVAAEGPQGANWGIWDENAVIKPGMDAFFNGLSSVNGQPAAVSCNGTIPGPVGIAPVYLPPYGSSDAMEIQVTGVQPASYTTATYIRVAGGWWTKPTFAQPTVFVNPDGTARIAIDTGGSDQDATEVETFLIPAGSQPPQASGGGKPSLGNAVASFDVTRTLGSISGTVKDNQGNPIAGAVIADPVLGSTTSGPDGKYSFYSIASSGTATLSVTFPNYSFPGSPATVAISGGSQIVNFSGTASVDLSAATSISPNSIFPGSGITETVVVSNAGPASATDALLTLSVPASFTSVAVSTTRGTCNAAALTCDLGSLAATAYATITVTATAGSAGPYVFGATVSGPDPDSNPANNQASQNLVVSQIQPTITWPAPGAITYGQQLSGTQLNATANAAGTFTYTPPAGTVLTAGNNQTLSVKFTPTDAVNYTAATATVSINVNKATPIVTWPAPAAIFFGGALGVGQLNATANVPGSFVYSPAAGTVLPSGNAQALSVTFTPVDTADYTGTSASTAINVIAATLRASAANLVLTTSPTRSAGNVAVRLTIANTGGVAAANVVVSTVKVGADLATPLPVNFGVIAAGASVQTTVNVPGSVGTTGAASSLSISGSYTGGVFSSNGRIALP